MVQTRQVDLLSGVVTPGHVPSRKPDAGPAPDGHGQCGELAFRLAATPARRHVHESARRWTGCVGAPYASDGGDATTILARLSPADSGGLASLGGEFVLASYDTASGTLLLATDLFASIPLYYSTQGDALRFGTDPALAPATVRPELDPQAIYDYLFFGVVPGSRSILAGVHKLGPATALLWQGGRVRTWRYWQPDFRRSREPPGELAEAARAALSAAVRQRTTLPDLACFLSGGLDSSTVCGYAARHMAVRVPAFTIGFDVAGFDESEYARICARHFDLELHEHRIRSGDVSECIDRLVGAFPEPFGNPSAVPAYLCARFAHDAGARHLLAGDGGDELFGGNERYQKQLVFGLYERTPRWLRAGAVDSLARLTSRAPAPFSKVASYVSQAQVALPDRLFSYNLLVRNDPATVLTTDFLRSVDPLGSLDYARRCFREPAGGDVVDRMLYLDWAVTLADNDLRKVRRACDLAGVDVYFPMLDPRVVALSTRVPSTAKLDLLTLRKFYKRALTGFLPPQIIDKTKHGFGVPVGPWVNDDPQLRDRVRTRLAALARRDILQPAFITDLLRLQETDHAVYYGSLIWPLFMLEEWLAANRY